MGNLKQKQKTPTKLIETDQICDFQRQGWGEGESEEGGQKLQTSIYKINKYLGCNVQHDDYS